MRICALTRMLVLYARSEEHTSELQSHDNLVCRLLLEKKKKNRPPTNNPSPTHRAPQQHSTAPHERGVARAGGASRPRGVLGVGWLVFFFFFNDPAPPEISPLSLPDALPIWDLRARRAPAPAAAAAERGPPPHGGRGRSEEHTSELQSHDNLVCRLLLEKKTTDPSLLPLLPSAPCRLV